MKQFVKRLSMLLTGVGLLFAFAAYAATDQVPSNRTVKKIHLYDGYAVIRYEPSFSAASNLCPGSLAPEAAVINWLLNPEQKTVYATALSAMLLNKTIGFGLKDDCSTWGNGTPTIYRMDIQ